MGGDDAGFTLIEMVMSILILVVIGTGTLLAMGGSLLHVASAHQEQLGVTLAEQQMETIRALPPTSLASYSPSPTSTLYDDTTYTVTTTMKPGTTGFEWAEVTVTWTPNDQTGVTPQVVDEELLCSSASC